MRNLIFLSLLAMTLLLTACTNNESNQEKSNEIDIYTTVYPLQYFAKQIGGDYVNVSSIYPPGANEHTFEPTQKDMIALADADVFFYIGLGLESFVENAKKSLANERVIFVPVAEKIDEQKLQTSVGHSHEEHEHEHDHHHGDVDPHVWLSPTISKDIALTIKNELVNLLPEQENTFNTNYERLIKRLEELDQQYKDLASQASSKTFFVSHAAFGYIAGNYGLTQIPVAGLNSQSEPSQKELAEIVALAKKHQIKYILFEQNVSSKLASVIQQEIGAESLILHNLSVLTEDDIKNNEDYFTLMEKNLKTLEKALNY
ncbi:metal ABC transporter solute-binding protein, Zn/Mn family [Ureibacillus thermosphaericus]|uniref:metal ABC transporter solute-binding protein, Zn/Mn family n=1 Tax=Ureibacillus thermosphaericus TaxID=51173 RepID=UPI0030C9BA7C